MFLNTCRLRFRDSTRMFCSRLARVYNHGRTYVGHSERFLVFTSILTCTSTSEVVPSPSPLPILLPLPSPPLPSDTPPPPPPPLHPPLPPWNHTSYAPARERPGERLPVRAATVFIVYEFVVSSHASRARGQNERRKKERNERNAWRESIGLVWG